MFSLSRPLEKTHESGGVPWSAIAWSLGMHALLLAAWSGALPLASTGITPAEPLKASLRTPPEAVAAAAASIAAAPESPPARLAQPRPVAKPLAIAADAVPPAPTFTESLDPVPALPVPAGGVPVQQARTETVTIALAAPQPQGGPDAAGLRQYRLALAGEARRFRSYPETARRAGLAGAAEVRVSVAAGAQRQTELTRSSGHAILDAAALEMLRSAAARAPLPDSLRGQEFAVLLPVVFEVED